MTLIQILAPLLAIAGWVLAGLAGYHMLSGPFDDRTCLTDCVSTQFWTAVAAGGAALLLGLVGLFRRSGRWLAILGVVLAVPLGAMVAGIIVIGLGYV